MAREIVPCFIDAAMAFCERATGLVGTDGPSQCSITVGANHAGRPVAIDAPMGRRNLGRNEKLATEKGEKLSAGR